MKRIALALLILMLCVHSTWAAVHSYCAHAVSHGAPVSSSHAAAQAGDKVGASHEEAGSFSHGGCAHGESGQYVSAQRTWPKEIVKTFLGLSPTPTAFESSEFFVRPERPKWVMSA